MPRTSPHQVHAGETWSLIDFMRGRFLVRVERIDGPDAHCIRITSGEPHIIKLRTLEHGLRGARRADGPQEPRAVSQVPPDNRFERRSASDCIRKAPARGAVSVSDRMRAAFTKFSAGGKGASRKELVKRYGVSIGTIGDWISKCREAERDAAHLAAAGAVTTGTIRRGTGT